MFTLPLLPYSTTAFGDLISAETFEYHHGKHHKSYVDKANKLVAEDEALAGKSLVELILSAKGSLFNQVGQIWNHSFYWLCLSPEAKTPGGKLADMIADQFGSHADLLAKLKEEATGHFGSGWTALLLEGERLQIKSYHDADCPVKHGDTPLLILDVWEHAYYIDYRNDRAAHIEAILNKAIDWDFVALNLDGKGAERADQKG
ncbi:MAG TPA: superoxide dismutase [Sphingorhabdus sp.]|jgi:Fe-Mn family superoxide dismutase|uniref:superoxide dismutase n=1 Tax=Sphingorhabdus sp. TaxID=1902408 RepID=UPI002C0663E7|nr:superoxide dismutase [Sphingorhabdus sp.]HMT41266.1 superoxide dismutase [Sphingorhabdus sp.]HMU21049.1 superoxide dismutase [Sphingorhabdus sp.]